MLCSFSFHALLLCEASLISSAHALSRPLLSLSDVNTSKIFVFGSSLGGAVALWLASQRGADIAGVVIENTFTSVEDMAFVLLKRICDPSKFEAPTRMFLSLFMTSHWRSLSIVPKISVPMLYMSGLADELIPSSQMRALYDAVAPAVPKTLYEVPGGEHNTTFYQGGMQYYQAFGKFISQTIAATEAVSKAGAFMTTAASGS